MSVNNYSFNNLSEFGDSIDSEIPNPPSANFSRENIPEGLKDGRRFICWSPKWKEATQKWTKPPREPSQPYRERAMEGFTEKKNAYTFDEAVEAGQVRKSWGLGISFFSEDSTTGFDFDDCVDPNTGEIDQRVTEFINQLEGYWEFSPSGTGLHGYVRGTVPEELTGNHDGLEVYTDGRYFTLTGNQVPGTADCVIKDTDTAEEVVSDWIDQYAREESNSSNSAVEVSEEDIPTEEVDESRVLRANAALIAFQQDPMTTEKAKRYTKDLLDGNYQKLGITNEGHSDRSAGIMACFSFLYWTIEKYGEGMCESKSDAYAYLTKRCNDHKFTGDGRLRKWLERSNGEWRKMQIEDAMGDYKPEYWDRKQRNKNRKEVRSGNYSTTTFEKAREALDTLIEQHGRYPTSKEVGIFAEGIDPTRDGKSHRNALFRLRDRGEVKEAVFEDKKSVYYPEEMEDPSEAKYIKIEGERKRIHSGCPSSSSLSNR